MAKIRMGTGCSRTSRIAASRRAKGALPPLWVSIEIPGARDRSGH